MNITISYSWSEKGNYKVDIIAKDIFDLLSECSDPHTIDISGPYLTIKNIEGGFGLSTEIENVGNSDAVDIELKIDVTGGLFVKTNVQNFSIPLIQPGESTELKLKIWGIGLGIVSDYPKIKITLSSTFTRTREKTVIAKIFGNYIKKTGECWSDEESFNGYTLFSPAISTKTFLINNSGGEVHNWVSKYKPALSVYLLENGCILRTALAWLNPVFWGGGLGGRVEIIDWNGTLLWSFEYSNNLHCLHHDVEMLPNGNILMIAWEIKSESDAIEAGRDPKFLHAKELWPNHIIEIKPNGSFGGDIVWEWHVWDHLIQDYDPLKSNYGIVSEHPELVDINFGGKILADWLHVNSIDYNADLDQIMLSVLNFNEIWIIDHSTTTEEAARHTGGDSGKGGDLLYRWGNPQAYRAGDNSDKKLFHQHDANWIKPECPGEGNILVFNNGGNRPEGDYSSVDELIPPIDENGSYIKEIGKPYRPEEPVWSYFADNPKDFYATNLAGAQRLPNGNTLVCDGPHGYFFEVTFGKDVVWEYLNQVPNLIDNHVFKIRRYSPDYPGLKFLI